MVEVTVLVLVTVVVPAHAVANRITTKIATVKIDQVPFFMFVSPLAKLYQSIKARFFLIVYLQTLNMHNIYSLVITDM